MKCFRQAIFLWSAALHGWTDGWIHGCQQGLHYKTTGYFRHKITWVLKAPCAELGAFFEKKFWMLHFAFCCSHLIARWQLYMLVCHAAFTWNQAAERWQTEDTPSTERGRQTSSLTEQQDRKNDTHVTIRCYSDILVFTTSCKNKTNRLFFM